MAQEQGQQQETERSELDHRAYDDVVRGVARELVRRMDVRRGNDFRRVGDRKVRETDPEHRRRLVDVCADRPDVGPSGAARRHRVSGALRDQVGHAGQLIGATNSDGDGRERGNPLAPRELREDEQADGGHDRDPRAAGPRHHDAHRRHEGHGRGDEPVTAVEDLEQREHEGRHQECRELRRILVGQCDGSARCAGCRRCRTGYRSRPSPRRTGCRPT